MNYWMSSVWHRRGSNWRLKTLIKNNFAVRRWPGQGMLASDWSLGCDTGLWLVNDRGWGEPLPNWGTASWFTELRRSLMQSVLYSKQYFKNTIIDCNGLYYCFNSHHVKYLFYTSNWSLVCLTSEGIFFFFVSLKNNLRLNFLKKFYIFEIKENVYLTLGAVIKLLRCIPDDVILVVHIMIHW